MQDQDVARGVVAIDGPSGSGKSTVARGVAERLGFGYLDTGAMYRAITWLVLQQGPALDELAQRPEEVAALLRSAALEVGTRPQDRTVRVADHDVTEVIRGSEVTAAVSVVAALPQVRERLGAVQRELAAAAVAAQGGMVMEGRDIGTAIFPGARLKIWLTATAEARGQRRAAEASSAEAGSGTDIAGTAIAGTDIAGTATAGTATAGTATAGRQTPSVVQPQASIDLDTVETVVEQLARRDRLDSTRQLSPLHCADDAHVIDTTPFSAEQVIDQVVDLWTTLGDSIELRPHDHHDYDDRGATRTDGRARQDIRTGASG